MSNPANTLDNIANARDFHTFVRRATPDELRETANELSAELARSDAAGIRTQLMDIVKERLLVLKQTLAVGSN